SPYVMTWTGAEIGSSGDTAFVVFMTAIANSKSYSVRTIDGGLTFSDTVRIDNETNRLASFPTVAVMPGGNPIVAYMGSDTISMLDPKYTITKSTDGGNSFLPPVEPVIPGEACDCCPSSLAISENTQALLFRNNISNLREMWASFSTDTCVSFPVSTNIDTTNWFVSSCPSSAPSGVIIGDSLVYTWMSDGTGDARVYIGTVNINDQQMGQHRQLYPVGTTSQNYPVIAGKGDTLGVVWLGYNGSSQDILFSWSLTGAAGIGANIDTITKGLTGHQSRPDIAFNNGKFHVVYSQGTGTQVHYVEGLIVPNVSVEEIDSSPILNFTSSNSNGSIEIQINSSKELEGEILILNALGQQIKRMPAEIKTGSNNYSINHQMNAGIYFVVLSTSDGKIYQSKVVVAK
ncbi:MAG TPA: T9SS type A sorting domain-containing protein, partial [Bacteroidia bacterium]|nr:T9SS type A sorting domain-containing protein [Bacteroidia bacterium]